VRQLTAAADVEPLARELASFRALRVAHSAANYRSQLYASVAAGVDLIEADVWPRWNKVVARHERGVVALPLIFDKWYVLPEIRPITLEEILESVSGRSGVYLDLKSDNENHLDHIVEIITRFGVSAQTAITSPHWHALTYIEERSPEVTSFYTVVARRHLAPFWDHLDEHPEVNGTAMRHGLLSPALVEAMHQRGLRVLAWTVDDPGRCLQLLEWGVDGIISNRLELLQAVGTLPVSAA
jgi:glycerophosphoryl diester phosphodiesterase